MDSTPYGTRFCGVYRTLPIAIEMGESGWRYKVFAPGGAVVFDEQDPVWPVSDTKEGAMLEAVTSAAKILDGNANPAEILRTIEWRKC
jgi:hypothetical protein